MPWYAGVAGNGSPVLDQGVRPGPATAGEAIGLGKARLLTDPGDVEDADQFAVIVDVEGQQAEALAEDHLPVCRVIPRG